jgi:two-component sensor histidine kinase
VFYKNLTPTTLTFRIKRITSSETEFEVMNEQQWVSILLDLQANHKKVCKYAKD